MFLDVILVIAAAIFILALAGLMVMWSVWLWRDSHD